MLKKDEGLEIKNTVRIDKKQLLKCIFVLFLYLKYVKDRCNDDDDGGGGGNENNNIKFTIGLLEIKRYRYRTQLKIF